MNKKTKIIGSIPLLIILILLIIAIFKSTYAINTNSITLECNKNSINNGAELSCKIVGHFSENVSGFSAKVAVAEDMEILKITSEWNAMIKSIESDNTIVLVDDENTITGNVNIANITLKSKGTSKNSSTTINLQSISLSYEDGGVSKDEDIPSITKSIHINSTNSTLSSLNVSGASINFEPNVTEYNINNLNQSIITISATNSDPTSKITGNLGEQKLNFGKNTFKIKVTSEAGNSTTYTINIYRPNTSPTLSSLKVEGAIVDFNSEKLTYDLTINSDKTNISATTSSNTAKIEGLGEKKLNYGKNEFKVIVTSETMGKRIYTLNIMRYDTNNTLKSIKINGEEVKIDSDHTIKFTTDSEKIKIEATADSDRVKSITGIGEQAISYGANELKIIVTAESGETKTYKLTINRTSNNNLSKLTVNGKAIDLEADIYNYDFEVASDIDSVEIDAELSNSKNEFEEGYGPRVIDNLSSKKTKAELKIKGQDGNSVTYIINIIKKEKANNNVNTPTTKDGFKPNFILLFVAIIIIVAVVVVFVIRKKKQSN